MTRQGVLNFSVVCPRSLVRIMPPKKRKNIKSQGTGDESATTSKYFKSEKQEQVKPDILKPSAADANEANPGTKSRLPFSFYDRDCTELAKMLLGKKLMRKKNGTELLSGIIVETEAYLGGEDKAAHSYNGKKTPKNEAMYMPPATAYVYHIYGAYTCLNISARGAGAAVLIRAMDPVDGISTMRKTRSANIKSAKKKELKHKELASGPSKLTQALGVDKASINKQDLTTFQELWLEEGDNQVKEDDVVACPRVGINYAEEWVDKPLRFYIKGNDSVSVRDKAEELQE